MDWNLYSFPSGAKVENEFSQEDLHAMSGLDDLRQALVHLGVRSFYVTALTGDGEVGYVWRNTDEVALAKLGEAMIDRGAGILALLHQDPHKPKRDQEKIESITELFKEALTREGLPED